MSISFILTITCKNFNSTEIKFLVLLFYIKSKTKYRNSKRRSLRWFGFLNSFVMEFIQSQYVGNISIEGDEYTVDSTKTVKPLTYKHDIDDLIIMESKCPSVANVLSKASNKGVAGNRTVSTSDMQCIMRNKFLFRLLDIGQN